MRALGITLVVLAVVRLGSAQVRNDAASQTSQADPCQLKSRVVGDQTHCDRYWECVNGQAQLYDCPNGLVFVGRNRGIADGCDYPWRGNYCQPPKSTANPPIGTEHCEWLYGIFGHETSCTRYWTCWNGTATEQFCIGGLLYNEETHACDWPQNVQGCQKHPLCKDDPNANVPLGKSCERYWACQGGYPRLQRCPATLVFDHVSRRCVHPPTANCAVPSTTPRPVNQDRQQQGGQLRQRGQQRPGGQVRQSIQGGQVRQSIQGGQQLQQQSQLDQQPQQQQQQPRRPSIRRPVPPRAQKLTIQEEELPPQEQFIEQGPLDQQEFQQGTDFQQPQQVDQQQFAPEPQAPRTPLRPVVRPIQRAQPSPSLPQLPFIPSGATPIQFNRGSQLRLPPIPGAIQIGRN